MFSLQYNGFEAPHNLKCFWQHVGGTWSPWTGCCTLPTILLIGFISTSLGTCFFRAVSRATKNHAAGQYGGSSSHVSTSEREPTSYRSTNAASPEVAPTAAHVATCDRVRTTGCSSGWQQCPFDGSDQSGTTLLTELQNDVSNAWAQGTHTTSRAP